jgi:hypothetical protein
MSTWTWTFIKPECLSKKQIEKLLEYAIKHTGGVYYDNYRKYGLDFELQKWLEFHKEEYDYFVNECDVPPEEMTEEYLTKELKEKIETCDKKTKYYQMVLDGKMTFKEMLENTKEGNPKHNAGYNHDFYIIKRNNEIYVDIKYEWWRNQRNSDGEEFNTVDSLIEEVKKSHYLSYYDEDIKEWVNEDSMSEKLEKKLRDYYGGIGDGNFYVHFG